LKTVSNVAIQEYVPAHGAIDVNHVAGGSQQIIFNQKVVSAAGVHPDYAGANPTFNVANQSPGVGLLTGALNLKAGTVATYERTHALLVENTTYTLTNITPAITDLYDA